GFWPKETEDKIGFETHLNTAPKFVASHTLARAEWANTTLLKGDILAEVARLKETPGGDIGTTGSCALVRSLMSAGLVDRLQLLAHPIVLGKGMRLFGDGLESIRMKLVEERHYTSGVVLLSYETEK